MKYWDMVRGDDLPSGVDLVTFDAGVNSGPKRGVRWTQRAVGVKQDGAIGRVTLAALASTAPDVVVTRATDYRLAFMQGLKIWKTFGRGWGRRVGAVRAKGLKLAGLPTPAIVDDARGLDKAASNDNRGAAATGTGAGGSGVAGVDQAASLDWVALVSLGFLGGLLVAACVYLALRAKAKHEAAGAMRDVVANREI
jgi:lysozyme family protein